MKKYVFLSLLGLVLGTACTRPKQKQAEQLDAAASRKDSVSVADIPEQKLVVPGAAVGMLDIGTDMQEIFQKLGKPDAGDAAMGRAWSVWYHPDSTSQVNDDELNLFSAYADSGMVKKEVRQIRVTSPEYRTDLGIGVGSPYEEMKKQYPAVREVQRLVNMRRGDTLVVYDDVQQGIAFDVCKRRVFALTVHRRSTPMQHGYLTLKPGWKPVR
ncbi:hypothetical protein C7T94_13190 [Pedobacter yulinensis]|uniref:Lipoprotein n=1 Tax=Pedobacter yulinensis TaxID=2126353 RepID=A0A2T3HM46_9SPHI|nr:hypothetical protein [Pedobacter yulinensis]PST83504.1 hypothetical protein C7T94_13190 [Pedobacter yulinensis]